MRAVAITVTNPFNPHANKQVLELNALCAVAKLQPKTHLPYICVLNGEAILRAEYGHVLRDGDIAVFITLPQGGGGGSNPLKIVLMVAVAVAAPHLAVGLLGTGVAGTVGALTTVGSIASAGIGFIGNSLINVALGPSNKPSSIKQQEAVAASPTYNLASHGNSIRLGSVIPDCYGRHIHYPDFSADPYTEYAGNEQYLYQQFCLGHGEYEIELIRIGETDAANFPEVEFEVVPPNTAGTLFPSLVETSGEVSGQEPITGTPLGPFPACSAGQTITAIAGDIVFPRGLYYANDNGGLDKRSVKFRFEARTINNAGAATGSWIDFGEETVTAATGTPIRKSYRYAVAAARYEVRLTRIDAKDTSSRVAHEFIWSSLRGYAPPPENYGDVTVLNMRARATNNLSGQSSRQLNVIKTRKLPIWDGETWSAPVATRNPAWAAVNVLRASYSGGMPDARIDLDGFKTRAETWDARGDYFDGLFDSQQVLFEAVNVVARVGRAKVYQQGGIWYCWRDEPQTLPTAMFNMRNIARGSVKRDFIMPTEATADAVEVSFLDANTWSDDTVVCAYPDSAQENITKTTLFGVTNRAQAWREGMFIMAQNRLRRAPTTFMTEMEGFLPTYGNMIAIAHDRGAWGQSGDVAVYDAAAKKITSTVALDFSAGGTHYMGFRKANGGYSGPYVATAGDNEFEVILDEPLNFNVYTSGTDRERTSFRFGPGEEHGHLALVMGVRPRSLTQVEISVINEDPAVHLADTGTVPAVSSKWNLPAQIIKPTVSELAVTLTGTSKNPLLSVSWAASAGAFSYLVELSYDGGDSWANVAAPVVSVATFSVRPGDLKIRVAPVGLARGDWVEWAGNPFLAPPPNVATLLISRQSDGTRQFDWALTGSAPPDLAGYQIRYAVGTNPSWDWVDLDPMHDGLLTASPWETNLLDAGTYTFAIKAFDNLGEESETATFVIADLGDQRLAGVLLNVLPHTQGWPGAKTSCHIEDGVLVSNSGVTWDDITSWTSFTAWNLNPAATISYEHTLIDLGGALAFTPVVEVVADGTVTVEESHSLDNVSYSSFASVGDIVTARYIKIKVTVTGSAIQKIRLVNLKVTAESLSQELNDVDTSVLSSTYRLAAGDIRLPISEPFQLITQCQVTLQNVGPGWTWELIDKDTSVGPRIKIYDATGTLADASIDALIRGA